MNFRDRSDKSNGQNQSSQNHHNSSNGSGRNVSNTNYLLSADLAEVSLYVIKKTEKLAQALYLLTNYLPIEEPFRRNVREKALNLVDQLYELQLHQTPRLQPLHAMVESRFGELIAILNVGVKAGLMSQMNFSVLEEEMISLRRLVSDRKSSTEPTINDDFFKTTLAKDDHGFQIDTPSETQTTPDRKEHFLDMSFKKEVPTISRPEPSIQLDRHSKFSDSHDVGVISSKYAPVRDTATGIRSNDLQTSATGDSNNLNRKRHGTNHSKRRTQILELFKTRDQIDINDVQSVIEGCSQKTMQRELKSMSDDGLIEKKGKRRWSHYVLCEGVNLESELNAN